MILYFYSKQNKYLKKKSFQNRKYLIFKVEMHEIKFYFDTQIL